MFDALRNDPQHHLGLGDIRLTIAQQDEILAMISPLPPAEGADDLKQYMTNLLYSAYDKGAKQVEPSESDRKDLDQWVEEMINGIDEYFKSKQPTAMTEFAALHAQRLAEKTVSEGYYQKEFTKWFRSESFFEKFDENISDGNLFWDRMGTGLIYETIDELLIYWKENEQ